MGKQVAEIYQRLAIDLAKGIGAYLETREEIIWLTQGEKPQRDAFYDFIDKKLTGEILDDLNYQFLRRLKKEGLITLEALYIDGTKIEANANRYTFV